MFRVTVPARPTEINSTPPQVLLVDDNRHGIAARRSILQELGYEITVSMCPLKALECFAGKAFDLVITDYKMPEMDGVELIARLRAIKPDIAVILISGFVEALGFTEESTGADAVIQKSSSEVPQLLRAVARLLRKKTPRKPATSAGGRVRLLKSRGKSVS